MKRYRPRGGHGETPAAEQRQGVPGKGNRAAEIAEIAEMQRRGGGPDPSLPNHLQARGRSGVDWSRWGREASGDAVQQRESADASSSAEVEPLLDARQLARAQRLNPRGQERRGWQPKQLDAAGLEVGSTAFALRIAHFQRGRGLVVDGIVGPETLGAAGVAPAAGRAPAGAAATPTTAPAATSATTPTTPTTAAVAASATTPTTGPAAPSSATSTSAPAEAPATKPTKPANTADDQLWLAVATYELGDTRLGRAHWEAYLQQLGADHWRRVLELDGLGVDGWLETANALEELEGGPPPPVSAAEKARREAASRLELLFTTRDRANKLTHELRGRLTADLRRRVLGPDTKMIRAGLYLGMQSAAVNTGVEEVLAAADETVGAVCALLAEAYALHCKSAELEQLRAQTVHSLEILRAHGLTGQLPGAFPRQRSGPTPELGDRPGDANVRPNRRAPSRSSELGDQAGDAIVIHEGPAAERIDVAALGLDPSAPESYDTYRARGLAAYGAGNDELAAAYGLLMDRAAARERGESARHPHAPVQRRSNAIAAEDVQAAAAEGIATPAQSLPHLERLQPAFQGHDLTTIRAHVGSDAARSATAMGAEAYATGEHIVFANTPDLETTAHEVAHVLQQRDGVQLRGGIGQVGDPYERQADAVAANVAQGRPVALAASASSAVPGGVQRRSWQMDIKTDLYVAMSGWGTNEDAIYRRLSHATLPELRQVFADAKLMAELRSELSASEMTRVLDLLHAPLADKLRLAMAGWGTDEDYIHRSLATATPAELQLVAADAALVRRLMDELSGDDLRGVLDRVGVSLRIKLTWAVAGIGTDEAYLFAALSSAPIAEVTAVAADAALVARVDSDLSGKDHARWRGTLAARLYNEASDALAAMRMLSGDTEPRRQRLARVGALDVQRALLDAVIVVGAAPPALLLEAFQAYWDVETAVAEGATAWPPETLRQIHVQMKSLPDQDTRSGVWRQLTLTGNAALTNRAAWNGGAGNFSVGANAAQNVASNQTRLTSNAAAGDTTLQVANAAAFGARSDISIGEGPNRELARVKAVAGTSYTLAQPLAYAHNTGEQLLPVSSEYGHGTRLSAAAAVGDPDIAVTEAARFAVGDVVAIDRATPTPDVATIAAIAGNRYTLTKTLQHAHALQARVTPDDATAAHQANWLAATVRHEIAHAVETALGGVTGFTEGLGGWWTGTDFDTWAGQMASPWATNDGSVISNEDRQAIKTAIIDAVQSTPSGGRSLWDSVTPLHAVRKHWGKSVPVILAADASLGRGDGFFVEPNALYQSNGKRFTISNWYKKFMYHNEEVVSQRVADYGVYAPAEFFAEAYTVFYEEAGRPGIADADLGRMIRNEAWRAWIRNNVHNRGHGPGAPRDGALPPASGPAASGGASFGRASRNSGP